MSGGPYPECPILIVDDDVHILEGLEMALFSEGFTNLRLESKAHDVLALLDKETFDAVLLDIIMPEISGADLLAGIKEKRPELPVIMVTGVNDVKTAVSCIRKGALDYLQKPVRNEDLAASLHRALEITRLRRENRCLSEKLLSDTLAQPEAFAGIATRDSKMMNIFRYCEAVAASSEPILITGETGTGKELIARSIHSLSVQKGEFVAVNVAGLDDQAFSDTLFGHTRGAFTGADRSRAGLLEKASGGTLFLDEIGDLNQTSQIRLLRVLQEKVYFPLGSDMAKPFKAKLVVATNKEIDYLQKTDRFRPDFYFRIRTHHIHLPPLRDRKSDIPVLFEHFLKEAAAAFRKPIPRFSSELADLLMTHDFPGNVRQFRALVYDAVASHEGNTLTLEPFRKHFPAAGAMPYAEQKPGKVNGIFSGVETLPTLREVNGILIEEALRRSGGNQRVASGLLGITPQALSSRLRRPKH